jgi:hypothetical protein
MNIIHTVFHLCIALCLTCTAVAVRAEVVDIATVFDSSNFAEAQRIKALLDQPEKTIDFAQAKLVIDKIVDPAIDVEAGLAQIDAAVKTIQSLLPAGASSQDKLLALKKYLYEAGAWNDYQPFQYDFADPKGTKISNKMLTTYLNTRKVNCINEKTMKKLEKTGVRVNFFGINE